VVFFFVWRFAVPAFNELLENRQRAVRADLEAAEAAKREAEGLRDDYREQLSGAREEAARIVEEARQAGESVKADIVAKASQEADVVKARAQEELAAERERAAGAIRRQVADLSLDVAEKVVGASLDRTSQQALVDRYIDELGGVG
jgi:F-type H+-transporting ATPase subunit b